jgi:uncharacterized protein YodC (DUF2158 family)
MDIGDIVRLETGGPEMVVLHLSVDLIVCTWFVGAEQQRGSFPKKSLVPKTMSARQSLSLILRTWLRWPGGEEGNAAIDMLRLGDKLEGLGYLEGSDLTEAGRELLE